MRKEYKGLGGTIAIIEDKNIKIKQLFISDDFQLNDVIYSSIELPKIWGERGKLSIKNQKNEYIIVFKKDDMEIFQELYDIICNNASASFRTYIQENKSFTIMKEIGNIVAFDQNSRRFRISTTIKGKTEYKFFNYDNIISYELLEGGNTITKGGLGSAVAGGVLFGSTGAIVGSVVGKKNKDMCFSLSVKITMNDITTPVINIEFMEYPAEKGGVYYNQRYAWAQECMSILEIILNQ